jgi:hypothetical protein
MAAVNNRTPKRVDVDTAQAVSNSPLAILTRASSSVRAVNLRTRPVALCRTVHITGGPFSTALREKDRRTLSKRLPDVTAFRDTSSHSANASGKPKPRGPSPRDCTLTRNGPPVLTVTEESRQTPSQASQERPKAQPMEPPQESPKQLRPPANRGSGYRRENPARTCSCRA